MRAIMRRQRKAGAFWGPVEDKRPEMEQKHLVACYELRGWNKDGIRKEALDKLDLSYVSEEFLLN
jgi:hypothetical protein